MAISQKSYGKLSGANKYAVAQKAKRGKYSLMVNSDEIINWQTTHFPYNKGLTRLGQKCKKEGISWVK